jgi:nucleoside-diphosphate-sugar epimerase
MSILVTGATGTIGSLIVQRLADAGAEVKALVRQRGKLSCGFRHRGHIRGHIRRACTTRAASPIEAPPSQRRQITGLKLNTRRRSKCDLP